MTDDKQHDVTTELNEALAAGFAAGNFDGVGAFYTEDTRLMPPRGKVLDGRASVCGFWLGVANRFSSMTFTTVDLRPLGETVRRETGTYVMGPAEGSRRGQTGDPGQICLRLAARRRRVADRKQHLEPERRRRRPSAGAGSRARAARPGWRLRVRGPARAVAPGPGGQGARLPAGAGRRARVAVPRGGQGGGQGGAYRQGGGRPSFQGGRRRGRASSGRRPGSGRGWLCRWGRRGGAYDGDGGLYSNPKG